MDGDVSLQTTEKGSHDSVLPYEKTIHIQTIMNFLQLFCMKQHPIMGVPTCSLKGLQTID